MKNCMCKVVCLLLMLCFLFLAVACAPAPQSPGEILTPEEVAALQKELLEKEAAEKAEAEKKEEEEKEEEEKEEEKNDPVPLPDDATVYWLKKGSVYHLSLTCSYLAEKENIEQGTVAAATTAGKEKLCSRCAKERE